MNDQDPSALDAAAADHGTCPVDDTRTATGCPLGDLAVQVVRQSTATPIPKALVRLEDIDERRTNNDGWVVWEGLQPGAYTNLARKDFYEPDPGTTTDSVQAGTVTLAQVELDHHVIIAHLWQEWHAQAGTARYNGLTNDNRRVVENPDAEGLLQAKPRLHTCFVERAVATLEAEPDGDVYYGRWQIIDQAGNVVREHARLSQANYAANHANARIRPGRHGWLWDGRNSAANRVFVAAGTYRSRITVKDATGAQVHESEAPISVEGSPYRIWITGSPMNDTDLAAELALARYGGRFLDAGGRRIARDCWIVAHRGEQNDGHVVFLGKGTIEAQKSLTGASAGAVATPHGRYYKGWVRRNPHANQPNAEQNADRVQIEDLGRTDQAIALTNPGGPAPNNPYADTAPNTPIKDGVQAHAGRSTWVGNATSVGCTTVSRISGRIVANPGCVFGAVRSLNSAFGGWGHGGAGENVSVRGPVFVNKQNKRNHPDDARIADGHGAPELDPPAHPAVANPDEPLHMQPSLQQASFGGYIGHEIPRTGNVADAPVNQARIRMILDNYAGDSLYHIYQRAVVFGHSAERAGGDFTIRAWFPRKIIRHWNRNERNLLVRGRCQIAWSIVHRAPVPLRPSIFPALHPAGGVAGTLAALPNADIGLAEKTWHLPQAPAPVLAAPAALAAGTYFSVIQYRVELRPAAAASNAWVPEPASQDNFPPVLPAGANRAALAAERVVTVGGTRFLEGRSDLEILQVP